MPARGIKHNLATLMCHQWINADTALTDHLLTINKATSYNSTCKAFATDVIPK